MIRLDSKEEKKEKKIGRKSGETTTATAGNQGAKQD